MKLNNNKSIQKLLILLLLSTVIIILSVIIFRIKKTKQIENFNIAHIPKIIHQTAPADKGKWHKNWITCQESWKKHFPDFEYKMWTDEDNYNLIKTDYNWFLDMYNKYDKNIHRVDIIRYFILDKYGGIYADMDYMCLKNFYNELPQDKISISESPYKHNEYLQNALMCSPKNHSFWIKVIIESQRRWENNENKDDVLYITGPKLITKLYENNKNEINVLPINKYNPDKNSKEYNDDANLFTKHLGTAVWL